MAKRQREPIRVEAYIKIDSAVRNLDEMTPEERSFIGAFLRVKCLNAMFAGQAEFSAVGLPTGEEIFPKAAKTEKPMTLQEERK